MKKQAAFGIVLTMCIAMAGFSACGTRDAGLAPYTFEPIVYDYDYNDWRKLETDAEVTVDGKLDELFWEAQRELSFGAGDIMTHTTTYLTDKGVYIGMYIEDQFVFSNPERDDWRNTSIELHLAAGTAVSRNEAVQIRVEAHNRTGVLEGVSFETDPYGWVWGYVPYYSRAWVDGTINSDACKGVSFEVFVPWSSIGMERKGDVLLLPAYNHTEGYEMEDGVQRLHLQASGDMNDPTTYLPFGEDGYLGVNEEPDDVLGQAASGRMATSGWDMSEKGRSVARTTRGGQQFTFFKQMGERTEYTATATISDVELVAAEGKAGIICGHNQKVWLVAFLVFKETGYSLDFVTMDDYGWYYGASYPVDAAKCLTEEGCVLSVERSGNLVRVYLDGALVCELESDALSAAGCSGFFTIDAKVTYSAYTCTYEK